MGSPDPVTGVAAAFNRLLETLTSDDQRDALVELAEAAKVAWPAPNGQAGQDGRDAAGRVAPHIAARCPVDPEHDAILADGTVWCIVCELAIADVESAAGPPP